jgi:hypothetical protein
MKGAAIASVFLASAAVWAQPQPSDVLSQLGITPLAARVAVDSVISSGVDNPGLPVRAFRLMPPATRGTIAAAGVAWLRSYTAGSEFKQQYAQIRQAHKPAPQAFAGTPEDQVKKEDAEQARAAEESRKAVGSLPPDQRAQIEQALNAAQALAEKMNTPEMRQMRVDGIKAERAARATQYEQELATWTRDYPENPAPVIARRLREFLAASEDIDFDATLVSRNGKMVFEKDAYEQKPVLWKMYYRAGREATTAARAAAQAWLKEIGP